MSLETNRDYSAVREVLHKHALHTVCESARCPNRHQCWNAGTATFMIMGACCTRNCCFCGVKNGVPEPLDDREPGHVAQAVDAMDLRYAVVTSVTRDDLDDGGARHFARTISSLRERVPAIRVEVLIPDFGGQADALDTVLNAHPDVLNHNLETVRRLQAHIRPQASYERSLAVLAHCARHHPSVHVKSGLMVGLGETDDEIIAAMQDIYDTGCRMLTIGQYLTPTKQHYPVDRYVPPEGFEQYAGRARDMGFKAVASAPLVRSSYRAEALLREAG